MNNIKINITFACFTLRKPLIKSIISKAIAATLKQQCVEVPCEINVLITDDKGIQAINKATREIDRPTDVLSFPMFQMEPGALPDDWKSYIDIETGRCPLGDMALSLERACTQASEYGHSARREIGYLTIHSMLHLLGYDHLDDGKQKEQMRIQEELIAATIPGMQRD